MRSPEQIDKELAQTETVIALAQQLESLKRHPAWEALVRILHKRVSELYVKMGTAPEDEIAYLQGKSRALQEIVGAPDAVISQARVRQDRAPALRKDRLMAKMWEDAYGVDQALPKRE